MKIIYVPTRFERDSLADFFHELDAYRDHGQVCIDFTRLKFSYPTAMLVAGAKIREWAKYRHQQGYKSKKNGINSSRRVISYLMHLGFFDFIFMGEGNCVGEAGGSSNYLPITRVTRPDFDPFDNSISDWYEDIQHESNRIAKVLCNGNTDSIDTYTYAIREIIRNVFEHSHATECYVCGQR
ncbi:hypothetical protein [Microbulbifer thermotolerans]|uniref:hypothetical protein n=1 Tax=Microbulbifer thermotolerans TaxID=252514 RepID=UPI00224AEFAD|nr:hypothetical protein [Microbulbifer thermotolerans]MCX2781317.1 hypothetical protein [Microbulbifer thermotolerans]MCX2806695.1 hypothetical protein [Microbulbifer thermotolerans]